MDDERRPVASANGRPNNKRTHATMSAQHRSLSPRFRTVQPRSIHDPHYHNEQPTSRVRLEPPPPERAHRRLPTPQAQIRQPGDGLDMRIPVMSTSRTTIDLTRESDTAQRPPRYERDIIEIASSDDEEETLPASPRPARRSAAVPGARQRSLRRARTPPAPVEPAVRQSRTRIWGLSTSPLRYVPDRYPTVGDIDDDAEDFFSEFFNVAPTVSGAENVIDLTEDDDLVVTGERHAPTSNTLDPAVPSGFTVGPIANLLAASPRLQQQVHHHYQRRIPAAVSSGIAAFAGTFAGAIASGQNLVTSAMANLQPAPPPRRTTMPGPMNYHASGWPIGHGVSAAIDGVGGQERYDPPWACPDGFTRSPEENEIVVCPNCGHELSVGDDEEQRQIWVMKQCGHAYCGQCVALRFANMKKKQVRSSASSRAGMAPLLKKCVLPDCGKSVTKASIMKLYTEV